MVGLVDVFGLLANLGKSCKLQCATIVLKNDAMDSGGGGGGGGNSLTHNPCSRASLSSPIKGMTSLKLVDRAMYSGSVDAMGVMVCISDAQVMGAPVNRTIQPGRDLEVIGSMIQFPPKWMRIG